jgi:hypothetical protein
MTGFQAVLLILGLIYFYIGIFVVSSTTFLYILKEKQFKNIKLGELVLSIIFVLPLVFMLLGYCILFPPIKMWKKINTKINFRELYNKQVFKED